MKRFASAVWYRSKAKLKDALEHEEADHPMVSRQTHWVPPEIWGAIIAYFAYDPCTLKVCAATCFTWYNIATPHLHRTLKFRHWAKDPLHAHLNPLEPLHKLDLLDFVKRVQFEAIFGIPWLNPAMFDSESLQYFHGLKNLQDLTIADLDFSKFSMGVGEYFGHFSPTLQSVALSAPRGTRRQLLDFFGLFPKLEDVKILNYRIMAGEYETVSAPLISTEGRLGGRLALEHFGDEELLKDMIVVYGGMRFTSVDLHDVQGAQLVLEACTNTLETLYLQQPGGAPQHCKGFSIPRSIFPTPELIRFFQHPSSSTTYRATLPFVLSSCRVHAYPIHQSTFAQLRRLSNCSLPSHPQPSPRLSSYSPSLMCTARHEA